MEQSNDYQFKFTDREIGILHELADKEEVTINKILTRALAMYQVVSDGLAKFEWIEKSPCCGDLE